MSRLTTLATLLACLVLGGFLFTVSSQSAGQTQPDGAKTQELKDALKQIAELKEAHEKEIKVLQRQIAILEAEKKENLAFRREEQDRAEIAALRQMVKRGPPKEAPKSNDPMQRIAELKAKLAKINAELGGPEEERKEVDVEQPKRENQKEREQRLIRRKLLELEREEVAAALAAAIKDAPDAARRLENLEMLEMLRTVIDTKGLTEKVKLKTALEYFADQCGGRLAIIVDKELFLVGQDPEKTPDPYEEEVYLPPVPTKMTMATALRLILAQVGQGRAIYLVRHGYLEVTTLEASSAARLIRRPMILASFEGRPLWEVLEYLSDESGLAIHLDSNVPKKIQAITANFRNCSLEDALVTVTEMAELKFVVMERSVFVTTPQKAAVLRKEEKKRALERKEIPPTAKKLEAAS